MAAAAVLASDTCCHSIVELMNHERSGDNLGFSSSLKNYNKAKTRKLRRFRVEMQKRELPPLPAQPGRVIKMVPTSEIRKKMSPSVDTPRIVNGSAKNVNGSAKNINGVHVAASRSLVKKDATTPPSKLSRITEFPPIEEPKVLPLDESFSWANENYNSVQRTIDVWSSLISLRIRVLLDDAKWTYIGGFSEEKQKQRRRKTASWLRERILHLGPTLIKLGQLLSTRSDLFPKEYVEELSKLQDRVPGFRSSKAKKLIEKELGAPVHLLFKKFEDLPLAAASLGQVHRAILHNGEKVVVKVQRPGLKKLFDIDLKNLKLITELFQRSETFGGPSKDWVGIYEECSRILYEEIDYVNEAKNADRFRRDFRNIKWVRVPVCFLLKDL